MTPAGIEPATFRFVAQHLNHCATAVTQQFIVLLFSTLPLLVSMLLCHLQGACGQHLLSYVIM